VANGEIIAEGTPQQVREAPSPWVHQFIYGEADGPVRFAYPVSSSLSHDLDLPGEQHE